MTSIPVLKGQVAERFLEFDAKKPTREELQELDEAEDFYLSKCSKKSSQAEDAE